MAKTLRTSIIIGGAISGGLRSAFSSTKTGLGDIGKAIQSVERRQRLLGQSIQTFGRMGRSVDGLRSQYSQLERAADRLRRAQSRLQNVNAAIDRNMARRSNLRGQLFDAVALGAAIVAPIKMAVDFESAMADVRKVVDFDTPQQFKEMTRDVIGLSRVLPMAAADIASIVTAGGQSGIARNELTAFAQSAIKVGVAFQMTAEDAGQMAAELRAAFRMSQGEVDTLFDKVNLLANTTAASEARIASVLRRVGPLGEVAGVASGEIAALGATLIGIGVSEEVAATGLQNFMLALAAGESATKRQRTALKALGLDAGKVAAGMQTNAQDTILSVLGAARALPKENQASVLQALFGRESLKAIAPMLTVYDQLVENLDKVNDAKRYSGAVDAEYAARAATSANNLQLFRNRIAAVGITIGNALLPPMNAVFGVLGPVVTKFGEWAEANPRLTAAIVGTVAVAGSLAVAGIAVGYAWTFAAGGLLRASAMMAKFRAGRAVADIGKIGATAARVSTPLRLVGTALAALGGGPVAVGIAAVVAGALLIRKYWEPIKAWVGGVAAGIGQAFGPVMGEIRAALAPLAPLWGSFTSAVSRAWTWVMQLLVPVEMTSEELQGAAGAGRRFGVVVGAAMANTARGVAAVVRLVVGFIAVQVRAGQAIANAFRTGFAIARRIVGSAVDAIMRRVAPILGIGTRIGGIVQAAAGFLGGSSPEVRDGAQAPAARRVAAIPARGPGRAAPQIPQPQARGSAGNVTDNSTTTIQIAQQPGESMEDLARRIEDERERRKGVARRRQLADGVT